MTRRQLGQAAGEVDGALVSVAARAKRQGVELRLDRGHHARVTVADLVHAVAVEIEDAPALEVDDVAALGACCHV